MKILRASMDTKYLILLLGIFGVSSAWRVATNWPSRERVANELTRQLDGTVIRPWDQSYYDKSAMMNTDFNSRPGAIAFVQNAGTCISKKTHMAYIL